MPAIIYCKSTIQQNESMLLEILQYWLDVIRQCRASGLTNQIWCEQHDISLKSYYYWLSKIRKLALEELPRKKNGIHMCTDQQSGALTESPAEFAELSFPDRCISRSTPAAILHVGSITVELYEGTSAQMQENILKAVQSKAVQKWLPHKSGSAENPQKYWGI